MTKLEVGTKESYPILIEDALLGKAGAHLKQFSADGRIIVVSDENVWKHHGKTFCTALKEAGLTIAPVVLSPGEHNKSMEGLSRLYNTFTRENVRRDSLIAAFGGGVVGDLCGFAAATFMRGIDYVQIPTTLLAQVDSSVGGKTAINLDQGKNLVGAFYQPKLVLIDPLTLNTLPEREWKCGMAEVIKYAAIRSAKLFGLLDSVPVQDNLDAIIAECLAIKAGIVANDEFDHGERMLLNFGHTFGHAIEKKYNFSTYNHGEAVAIGMAVAAAVGEELSITPVGTAEKLNALLNRHAIENECPCMPSELAHLMENDKKSGADGVVLILLKTLGNAIMHKLSYAELHEILRKVEERWQRKKQ